MDHCPRLRHQLQTLVQFIEDSVATESIGLRLPCAGEAVLLGPVLPGAARILRAKAKSWRNSILSGAKAVLGPHASCVRKLDRRAHSHRSCGKLPRCMCGHSCERINSLGSMSETVEY